MSHYRIVSSSRRLECQAVRRLRSAWRPPTGLRSKRTKLLSALLFAVITFSTSPRIGLGKTAPAELIEYVAQSVCVDAAGKPTPALPVIDACPASRPQRSDDIATYRKHDWPNALDDPSARHGYQASDSVVQRRGSHMLIVQTFDFGTGGREFGHFDTGFGDGGQVLMFIGDWASFAMTEDGGGGVQWFLGQACRSSVHSAERFLGWLVFSAAITAGEWRTVMARLNIATSPHICPNRYNDALTRYRRDRIGFPIRIADQAGAITDTRRDLDVVVSEHFGGRDRRTADHLERFYMAKGLGLIRWERWANGNLRQPTSVFQAERMLAQTARCPSIDSYAAPDPNWRLVDCRTWTTLVKQTGRWSVDDYRWEALKAFGPAQ